jgi:hypothetical protein
MVNSDKVLELIDKISWIDMQGANSYYEVKESVKEVSTYRLNTIEMEVDNGILICTDIDGVLLGGYYLMCLPIKEIRDIIYANTSIKILLSGVDRYILLNII